MRGVALPRRGLSAIDFVTTAPMSEREKNCANSLPELAHPLAVKSGVGNQAEPILVEKSKALWLPM